MRSSVRGFRERLARVTPARRRRLALAAAALLVGIAAFATCGGCGRRLPPGGASTAGSPASMTASASAGAAPPPDAATLRDPLLWSHAKDGDVEDLAALAAHEGAAGLIEATREAALRPVALRAMGHARGWAQLPFLAKAASGKDDEEARVALDATLELAVRPRRAEDPEDAEELREGCSGLAGLARDAARPTLRRVAAIRALRMIPCPPPKAGEELPTDLDAR